MENEMIYNVDIADFKVMSDKLEYLDENVMVSQTIEGLPKSIEEMPIWYVSSSS